MYVFTERVTDVTAHGFLEFGQDSGMFNGNLGFKGGVGGGQVWREKSTLLFLSSQHVAR